MPNCNSKGEEKMEQASLVERLEQLERENMKFRRSARFMKLLVSSLIAITVAGISIPIAHSITVPGPLGASEFDLLGPGLRITARLHTLRNGPNLTFYDNSGKIVADVGWVNDSTSAQAGLSVFDGNSVLAGNGVARAEVGYTSRSATGTGVGLANYDATGVMRSNIGQSLDGSNDYEVLYDQTGLVRDGIIFNDTIANGFYTYDANGTQRVNLGQTLNNHAQFELYDASGNQGLVASVDPADAFNGLAVFDGNGVKRSDIEIGAVRTYAADGTETGLLP
jgi:hypothetical protein